MEWNPPKFERPFKDAVNWPAWCRLDIVIPTVNATIHDRYENSKSIKLFEYQGKNLGIRLARGEWVIVINPDIVMSKDLVKFLARKENLEPDTFYRADRYDFSGSVTEDMTATEVADVAKGTVHYIASAGGMGLCRRLARYLGKDDLPVGSTKFHSNQVGEEYLGEAKVALAGPMNRINPQNRSRTCYYTLPQLTNRFKNLPIVSFFDEIDDPMVRPGDEEPVVPTGCHDLHVVTAGDWTLIRREHLLRTRG